MMSVVAPAFGRYLLVGSAATAAHYTILIALVEIAGAAPAPSAAVGAACSALAAYAGNRRFTFPDSAPHSQALPRFLAVAAFGAVANGALVWTGTEVAGLQYLSAQLVATVFVLWSGFMLNRRWSFP
jgi:putative flippase GtrA